MNANERESPIQRFRGLSFYRTDTLSIFHRKEGRVDAHILVCFLSLALWRSLEQWMSAKGLGTCARQFLLEMDKVHSMDVVLPLDTGAELRLRTVSRPDKPLALLLHKLGLNLPQTPKRIENVVQTP